MGKVRNGSGLSGRAMRYVTGDAGTGGAARVRVINGRTSRLPLRISFLLQLRELIALSEPGHELPSLRECSSRRLTRDSYSREKLIACLL